MKIHWLQTLVPQEEIQERPQITSMIGSLANYSNTIPNAPAEGDGKPAQASAQMGKHSLPMQSLMPRDFLKNRFPL